MPFDEIEDLPAEEICISPEHNPPGMYVYQQGKKYVYRCPACGKITTVTVPRVSMSDVRIVGL